MKVKLRVWQIGPGETRYRKTRDVPCEPGRLSDLLARLSVRLPNACGGTGRCGLCRVLLVKKTDPAYAVLTRKRAPLREEVLRLAADVPACRVYLEEPAHVFLLPAGETPLNPAALPAFRPRAVSRYALAADLGSTNIDGVLLDLDSGRVSSSFSVRNPQTVYGSDIISRLGAIAGNPRLAEECREKTHRAVAALLSGLAYAEGIPETALGSVIKTAAAAGNSVVTDLFLGIETEPLTVPPYEPLSLDFALRPASSCGFPLDGRGKLLTVPLLTGLIGGDLTAGIFALQTNPEYGFTFGRAGPELLVDIGTNSEMLLFAGGKIYAAQAAAGPVFEGESISCGVRSAPDAVMRVKAEGNTPLSLLPPGEVSARLRLETFGPARRGAIRGLAGSAVIDLIAELLRLGDLSPNGRLKAPIPIAPGIELTKKDVRQVQLALGAIRAGLNVLLETAGTAWRGLKTLYISGGLGSGIDFASAQRAGLFSKDLDPDRCRACGNTSLQGTVALLRRPELLDAVPRLRRQICRVSLGESPRFKEEFLRAMTFPAAE